MRLATLVLIGDGAVCVRDGRFVAVGPGADGGQGFTVDHAVDGQGRLVTPGLATAFLSASPHA